MTSSSSPSIPRSHFEDAEPGNVTPEQAHDFFHWLRFSDLRLLNNLWRNFLKYIDSKRNNP